MIQKENGHTKENILITVIEKTIGAPPFNSDCITFKGASVSALPDIPHALRSNSFEEYKKKTNPAEIRCLITHRNRRNQRSRATWIKRDEAAFIVSFIFLVIPSKLSKTAFKTAPRQTNLPFRETESLQSSNLRDIYSKYLFQLYLWQRFSKWKMLPLLKIAPGFFQNHLSPVTRDVCATDCYITVNLLPKKTFHSHHV